MTNFRQSFYPNSCTTSIDSFFQRSLLRFTNPFGAKADAKLLLFLDMTKFLCHFFEKNPQVADFQYPHFCSTPHPSLEPLLVERNRLQRYCFFLN